MSAQTRYATLSRRTLTATSRYQPSTPVGVSEVEGSGPPSLVVAGLDGSGGEHAAIPPKSAAAPDVPVRDLLRVADGDVPVQQRPDRRLTQSQVSDCFRPSPCQRSLTWTGARLTLAWCRAALPAIPAGTNAAV